MTKHKLTPVKRAGHPASFKERTGMTFGRLYVIGYEGKNWKGQSIWKCRCSCGVVGLYEGRHLGKKCFSCGCFQKEGLKKRVKIHGLYLLPEYRTWIGIKVRCYNPKNAFYKNYGGRGIRVCERWLSSVENFVQDMGKRPSSKHSIERLDVNGNYEPSNCIWATQDKQSNNRRSSVFVEFKGEKLTISQWSNKLNIKRGTIVGRLLSGWSIERALTTPVL